MSEVGKLQDTALKRKRRLEELRKTLEQSNPDKTDKDSSIIIPTPTFRSYKPISEEFQKSLLPDQIPGEVKELVKEELEQEEDSEILEELDFASLAPRKPDWDLKRNVAKKLEILEKRTKLAIAELVRERIKNEDLVSAVNAVSNESTLED